MYRAGYDPQAFVTFFEKIENLEKQKPGAVAKVFENHPQTPDRIEHTEEEIAKILPPEGRVPGHDLGIQRRQGPAGPHREQASHHRQQEGQADPPSRQHIAGQHRSDHEHRRSADPASPRRQRQWQRHRYPTTTAVATRAAFVPSSFHGLRLLTRPVCIGGIDNSNHLTALLSYEKVSNVSTVPGGRTQ